MAESNLTERPRPTHKNKSVKGLCGHCPPLHGRPCDAFVVDPSAASIEGGWAWVVGLGGRDAWDDGTATAQHSASAVTALTPQTEALVCLPFQ